MTREMANRNIKAGVNLMDYCLVYFYKKYDGKTWKSESFNTVPAIVNKTAVFVN